MSEQRDIRIKKLTQMQEENINPYGEAVSGMMPIAEIISRFVEFETKSVCVAGRILAIRKHGKAGFIDVRDATDKIQVYFKQDLTPTDVFNIYHKFLDIGDIIMVAGKVFKTKTGEVTILCEKLKILSKSIRPLPEKWHGLADPDLRYRMRYLDMIMNRKVFETFLTRANIIRLIRQWLEQRGFIEAETPMMHPIPGGASARPFITYHNALDMQLYLRIAPELYLKRLLVGGFEKVYEINRNFRNEGCDTKHNPEFTMLELYQAYADYNTMMELTEELITYLVKNIHNSETIEYAGWHLDFKRPYKRSTYRDLLREHAGIDITDYEKAKEIAIANQIPIENKSNAKILNDVFEKLVEPKLTGPIFVIDYPYELCPLAKRKKTEPEVCERFELFIGCMEIANAFSELNDPFEQRKRFLEQARAKSPEAYEGGVEGKIDDDFILALEYGMPPAGGLGIGIDRLVMILTNNTSVREVILFPTLRHKE